MMGWETAMGVKVCGFFDMTATDDCDGRLHLRLWNNTFNI